MTLTSIRGDITKGIMKSATHFTSGHRTGYKSLSKEKVAHVMGSISSNIIFVYLKLESAPLFPYVEHRNEAIILIFPPGFFCKIEVKDVRGDIFITVG